MATQTQRGASDVGSIKVLTLPPLPRIQPWLQSNRPEDKTLIRFGEWFDKQMELWRRQTESSLSINFNTIRLMKDGDEDSGLTEAEVQAMIDQSVEGIEAGDTIIQGVTEERVISIVNEANATFIWPQDQPATVWTITHNLGRYPPVSCIDSGYTVVFGDVNYVDSNILTVSFVNAFSGKAFLG